MDSDQLTASLKRITEGWSAKLWTNEEIASDPGGWCRAIGADPIPEVALALAEGKDLTKESSFAPYYELVKKKLVWRDEIRRECAPADPKMKAWRERQMTRCQFEIGANQNKAVIHAPLVVELASGCSAGCWFCALDAPKLEEVWRATPENIRLWNGIQQILHTILGGSARHGTLYWATEPLDCPDYEWFCNSFYEIHGRYPQTTTAVPLRNVARTKAVLKDSYQKGCAVNRFSVHTADVLRRIFKEFTPLELLHTELLLEHEEAGFVVSPSGRAQDKVVPPAEREKANQKIIENILARTPSLRGKFDNYILSYSYLDETPVSDPRTMKINFPATTACISGFHVNMCKRTVELITPCASDAQWRNGYMVLAKDTFTDADSFGAAVSKMIDACMQEKVEPNDTVAFSRRVNRRITDTGFVLSTVFANADYQVTDNENEAKFRHHVGMLLERGGFTAGYIALECYYIFGRSEANTLALINDVFIKGLLDIT